MQGSHRGLAHPVGRLVFVAAALALVAVALRPAQVEAAPGGTLAMSPTNVSIALNDSISITLDLVGAANVHETQFTVTYNPAVVSVVDADSGAGGTQILPGAFPGTTADGAVLQNSAASGTISYHYELDDPNGTASGGGTMATVQFLAVGVGNANIAWSAVTLTDDAGATSSPSGSAAVLAVGQAVPTSTPTDTPAATQTPSPTSTPSVTDTPSPTQTGTPAATDTPGATATATPTGAASATATARPSATASTTLTPAPSATPRVTLLDNSNQGKPPQGGVDPSQSDRANGLPSAGNDGPGVKWWRWVFFLAALMLGAAGWFFTFAVHYGDREPILVDRFDRRRRRRRY